MSRKIRVESLVEERACPYGCPACAEEARERQVQRELIMVAQAELFDEPTVAAAMMARQAHCERRAA